MAMKDKTAIVGIGATKYYLKDVVPYVAGIIQLDETQGAGARLMGNILDCVPEDVRIGDAVQVVFEPVGDNYAMMRFRHLGATA